MTNAVAKFKWTEENTEALRSFVANVETPIQASDVEGAAAEIGTSTRSIAAKLRRMGYEVATKEKAAKLFSADEEAALVSFVQGNANTLTYAEIAAQFQGGKFSPRAIQGKILHLELTKLVKPSPKKVHVSSFTAADEAVIVTGINNGQFIEEIAEKLGRKVSEVRGKILAMKRKEGSGVTKFPETRDKKEATKADVLDFDFSEMTVAQIAERTQKTERGIKTMLTRRQARCADYDGAAKAAKAAAAE